MSNSIGQTKVGIGTVLFVLLLLAGGFVAILVKIGRGSDNPVETALSIMRRQVASDIALQVDPKNARVNDARGSFYFVCGEATLNRPGIGELALNNVTQRYIVTVNRRKQVGMALFDGSSSAAGKFEFAAHWEEKCASAVPIGA